MNELFTRARKIAGKLARAGHEVYFAGGCVRDHLLGREPADIDIATSATPDEVQRLFRRTIAVGKQFGVIVVLDDDLGFDVATFRTDGAYGDGRRPDEIQFSTAEEDVARRDFTINGLLMRPDDAEVVDHVGGVADLKARIVRTIGVPRERFEEDRLRILRGVRFATRLAFDLEDGTAAAIRAMASHAADPSAERVMGELQRIWTERAPAQGLRLLDDLGLLSVVLPEVAAKREVVVDDRLRRDDQPKDAYARLVRLLDRLDEGRQDPALIWALLLEDSQTGGPPGAVAGRARATLERLRASRELMGAVADLVALRDRTLFCRNGNPVRRSLLAARADLARLDQYRTLSAPDLRAPGEWLAKVESETLPPPLLRGDRLAKRGFRGREIGRVMRRLRWHQLHGDLRTAEDAEQWLDALL